MVSRTGPRFFLSLLTHKVHNGNRILRPVRSASSLAIFMGQKFDVRGAAIYEWFKGKMRNTQRAKQLPNEVVREVLGANLTAATFVIAWGGSVKVQGRHEWLKDTDRNCLPKQKDENFIVEGIDTTGVKLLYESIGNFKDLEHLRYFKISKNDEADDFFLSNLFTTCRGIEYLEINDCPNITERGVACVHHLENLKCLKISSLPGLLNIEIFTLLLEEMMPECVVYVDEKINRRLIKESMIMEKKKDRHVQHVQQR